MALYFLLLIPAVLAVLQAKTGKYPFSAAVTLTCAAITVLCGKQSITWPVIAGLVFSVVGDWFMAHPRAVQNNLLFGIAFFFCAHALFSAYSLMNRRFTPFTPILGVTVLGILAAYAFGRVLSRLHVTAIRVGFLAYAAISALSLTLASSQKGDPVSAILFFCSILLICVSDIFIAENDFCCVRSLGKWICPLYYACHIAMTASVITRTMHL